MADITTGRETHSPASLASSSEADDFFQDLNNVLRMLNTFACATPTESNRRRLRQVVVQMQIAADALEETYDHFLALSPWLDTVAEEFPRYRSPQGHFIVEPAAFEYDVDGNESNDVLVSGGQSILGLQGRDSVVSILGEIEGKSGAEAEALVQDLEDEWEEAGALSVWRGRSHGIVLRQLPRLKQNWENSRGRSPIVAQVRRVAKGNEPRPVLNLVWACGNHSKTKSGYRKRQQSAA